jgi:iron(III) transport system ATP-binding protein
MTFIRLEEVSKYYGHTRAVADMSLTIPKSKFTVLLGRSGCGKTTTLRLIAGLEKPDSGNIWIGEQQVSGSQVWVPTTRRQVGMVFQDYALFPHLNVAQNVAFGLTDLTSAKRKRRIADMLDLVGLMGMEERYPHQLSGGQQQRVALARALAPSPDVVLMDEPFSNLDEALRQSMREEVRSILQQAQATTIFVTHDQEEALRLADKLVVMEGGRMLQHGPPEDVYRWPVNHQVARFLGEVNILAGHAEGGIVQTALGRLQLHNPDTEGAVDVILRPEAITLTPDPRGALCIESILYFGFHQLVTLRLENGSTLHARTWSHAQLAAGERVRATVNAPVAAIAAE